MVNTRSFLTMDAFVRDKMRGWPQIPPGLEMADARQQGLWLKARPGPPHDHDEPALKIPGAARMRTLPDGLWLWFGGSAADPYVDLFAIEVCGTMQNLLDKRSRYAPSLHSLLVACPAPWLNLTVAEYDNAPRWKLTGLLERKPEQPLILPVRDMRVLYALKPKQFQEFAEHHIAHAHELFAPVDILIDESGWRDPALRSFLARAARRANFWESAAPAQAAQGAWSAAEAIDPPGRAEPEEPLNIGRLIGRPRRQAGITAQGINTQGIMSLNELMGDRSRRSSGSRIGVRELAHPA